ncbi:phage tail tape measure protein [Flagellimonas lutimaris]|uniref:phage tail tape measure protein n=1 Tax=Flagellimonas lutimaris TaxID=475082 RepID=UPI003F5CC9F5
MVKGDNSLYFATGLDNSGLRSGALDTVSIIQGLSGKISKINPFAALAVGATAAFATIGNGAYNMAKDFEQAMKEVATISDAVQEDFQGISNSVFDLSKITPDGPEKLAKAYYQIVSAGYDGAKGLKLLEVSAKSAIAGVTDTITSADGLTTILNSFNIEVEKSDEVADSLFNTVKLGKTTFEELSSNISQVGPIAASSNIPLNEVLATVASLTKQGVPTAQAMTQIRSAIVGLNESGRLDGTKTLQENMQALYNTLEGNQTLIQGEIGRIEGVQAILAIAGKNAQSANKDLQSYQNTIGATEKAFQEMATSNVNQWAILRNRIKATTQGIGDTILEFSSEIAKFFNDALEPSDRVIENLEKERLKLLELESRIKDANTTNEDRVKLIDELRDKYPDLLKNIDSEKVSNKDLTKSIKEINEQLINKIILQRQDGKIGEQNEDIALKRLDLLKQEDEVREQLVKIAEREGKTIKDNATLVEQGRDLLSQFTDEQLRGGRLINPLVEFGFQLSELVNIQKSLNFEEEKGADLLREREELAKRLGITLKSSGGGTNGTNDENKPDPGPDEPDLVTYEEYLQKKRELYQEYENYVNQVGKDKADERFQNLLKEGSDYGEFLRDQLAKVKNFEKERAVINAAADAKLRLTRDPLEKVEVEIKPIVTDVEVDTQSIRAIEQRLKKLNEAYEKSQSDAEKKVLGEKIRIEQEKLEVANKYRNQEADLYDDLTRTVSELNNKELRNYIKYWRDRLKVAKDGSQEAAEAEGKIMEAQKQRADNISYTTQQISGVLGEASSLFRKFGEEDVAQLLDQLAGVAEGIGQIASGDPLQMIQGSLKVLNSAITVEVVSDTAKFEAAIEDLEKAIDQLDYVISKSLGQDKVTSRRQAIKDLEDLERQADLAYEAELEARKQVKLLGITIGKKGSGSGTDPAKLEELEQQAEEARRKVVELRNEINELYTGATSTTLADSIIEGFKEGKRSAADFAETFEEMMRNAMFEALKLKYLEKASNDFFDQFGALAGDDNGLTAGDINALRNLAENIFSNSVNELEALDSILKDAGIAGGTFGGNQQRGLAGSISTITQETASIMAGTLNSIRLDVREGVEIAQQNTEYLSQIVINTSLLEKLDPIDRKLGNIESVLNQSEAQGF